MLKGKKDEGDIVQYVVLRVRAEEERKMREWLSGGVSPCQGEGRGFESRLALYVIYEEIRLSPGLLSYCKFCGIGRESGNQK